ncbi:MAG: TonB-dependent receptor domain-containing protein [Parasphingopyxis sp.]|uniref:TonB-dependent receptor domain-containing protein n=1 Tax=Parasphingopyxis sp. TaxID=1920299 RepID=UPI003FA08B7D
MVGDAIVVTATRNETAIDRIPAQIDVIDREEIELNNIQTLADALAFVPGVNAVQSGPAGSITSVFARGSNSKHTLALFDGIRLNDASAPNGQFNFGQDLLGDAERVEVVRGPLSSVYGSDAVGGVVNIIPRIGADKSFAPYFEASAGDFSTFRGVVGAAGTMDRLRYNFTFEALDTDGFDEIPERMSTRTGDPDGADFIAATVLGIYEFGGGFSGEALLRVRNAASEFDTFSGGPTGFQRADDPDIGVDEDNYTIWRIGGIWTSPSGGFETKLRVGQVLNERQSIDDGMITDTAEGERTFVEWLNSWTPSDTGGLIDPVISFGGQYQLEEIAVDPQFSNPLSRDEYSYGAYLLATIGIGGIVDFTASARVDEFEDFGTQGTYNVGAVVHVDGINTRFTAAWGTSFKAPTLSERFSSSPFVTPNPDLEPEDGETWEIGFETRIPIGGRDDAWRFGLTYFDSRIENLIENVFDFVNFTGQNQNVGLAEIDGFEVFADVSPVDQLRLRFDYTYTDAINANTGARLLRRPKHSWSASAEWNPRNNVRLSLRYLDVGRRADITYDDDGFFLAVGDLIDGYEIVTLAGAIGLTDEMEVFLSINNLFDEVYEQPEAYRGAPRSASIGVRGRF